MARKSGSQAKSSKRKSVLGIRYNTAKADQKAAYQAAMRQYRRDARIVIKKLGDIPAPKGKVIKPTPALTKAIRTFASALKRGGQPVKLTKKTRKELKGDYGIIVRGKHAVVRHNYEVKENKIKLKGEDNPKVGVKPVSEIDVQSDKLEDYERLFDSLGDDQAIGFTTAFGDKSYEIFHDADTLYNYLHAYQLRGMPGKFQIITITGQRSQQRWINDGGKRHDEQIKRRREHKAKIVRNRRAKKKGMRTGRGK